MTALELAALKSNDDLISIWADNHPTMLEPIDKTLRMLKKKGHMLTETNALRRARIIDILERELQSRMNRGEISTSTPIRVKPDSVLIPVNSLIQFNVALGFSPPSH